MKTCRDRERPGPPRLRRALRASQKERKFMKYGRAVENRDANESTVSDDWGRRLWAFDVEALCAKARRTTGLEDFGAPPIEQALSVLVDSLEREAALHRVRPVPDANASFGFVEDPFATDGRVEKTVAGGRGVFAYRKADFHHGHAAQRFDVPSRTAGGRSRPEGAASLGSDVSCHRERAGQGLARSAGLERRDELVVVSPAGAGGGRRLSYARPDAPRVCGDS